jgi:hypothetical protein
MNYEEILNVLHILQSKNKDFIKNFFTEEQLNDFFIKFEKDIIKKIIIDNNIPIPVGSLVKIINNISHHRLSIDEIYNIDNICSYYYKTGDSEYYNYMYYFDINGYYLAIDEFEIIKINW